MGFLKPHLPQVFPKRYLDMYAGLPAPKPAANPFAPVGSPSVAWAGVMAEISEYSNIQQAKGGNHTARPFDLPPEVQVGQKRGYHAATTFVDAQIGRLLTTLDALSLRQSTIIAVIGDQCVTAPIGCRTRPPLTPAAVTSGWKLGEHGGWAKKTNFWNVRVDPCSARSRLANQERMRHSGCTWSAARERSAAESTWDAGGWDRGGVP